MSTLERDAQQNEEQPESSTAEFDLGGNSLLGAVRWAAPDGFALVGGSGTMVMINPTLDRQFGFPIGSLVGRPMDHLLPRMHRAAHPEQRQTFSTTGRHRAMGSGVPLRASREDGSTFSVQVALSPVTSASGPCTLAIVREQPPADAVASRRAEEAVTALEEQQRIAHGIHDDVLQDLFGPTLSLGAAESAMHAPEGRPADELEVVVARLRSASLALREPTRMAKDVRSRVMRRLGACRQALGVMPTVRFGGPVDFTVPQAMADELLHVQDLALRRIEDLRRSTVIEVAVAVDEVARLMVVDHEPPRDAATDGAGTAARIDAAGDHAVLSSVRDRALGLGGTFTMECDAPGCTTLRWTAPRS